MTEYPDYFEVGTRILSAEEKTDPMKFFHTCDRDTVHFLFQAVSEFCCVKLGRTKLYLTLVIALAQYLAVFC
jgi:hypothetical protein